MDGAEREEMSCKFEKPFPHERHRGVRSVVHLLKPVVAFVVAPIDEDGSVINAGAMFAPAFKAYVSRRKGSDGRPLPREIALGPVSAEDYGRASVAVPIAPGFVLSRIPYIKDADGPHEIELWSADIDISAILNEVREAVGGNEVFIGIRGAPNSLDWLSNVGDLTRWKGLAQSCFVGLQERFIDAACAD